MFIFVYLKGTHTHKKKVTVTQKETLQPVLGHKQAQTQVLHPDLTVSFSDPQEAESEVREAWIQNHTQYGMQTVPFMA